MKQSKPSKFPKPRPGELAQLAAAFGPQKDIISVVRRHGGENVHQGVREMKWNAIREADRETRELILSPLMVENAARRYLKDQGWEGKLKTPKQW